MQTNRRRRGRQARARLDSPPRRNNSSFMGDYHDNPVGRLLALGFAEYEARVYVTLLQHGPLSGYEVSRHSGVPRPNVYPVLQRLIERGAVEALTARRGARYAARP